MNFNSKPEVTSTTPVEKIITPAANAPFITYRAYDDFKATKRHIEFSAKPMRNHTHVSTHAIGCQIARPGRLPVRLANVYTESQAALSLASALIPALSRTMTPGSEFLIFKYQTHFSVDIDIDINNPRFANVKPNHLDSTATRTREDNINLLTSLLGTPEFIIRNHEAKPKAKFDKGGMKSHGAQLVFRLQTPIVKDVLAKVVMDANRNCHVVSTHDTKETKTWTEEWKARHLDLRLYRGLRSLREYLSTISPWVDFNCQGTNCKNPAFTTAWIVENPNGTVDVTKMLSEATNSAGFEFGLNEKSLCERITKTNTINRAISSAMHGWNESQAMFIKSFAWKVASHMDELKDFAAKNNLITSAPTPSPAPAATTANRSFKHFGTRSHTIHEMQVYTTQLTKGTTTAPAFFMYYHTTPKTFSRNDYIYKLMRCLTKPELEIFSYEDALQFISYAEHYLKIDASEAAYTKCEFMSSKRSVAGQTIVSTGTVKDYASVTMADASNLDRALEILATFEVPVQSETYYQALHTVVTTLGYPGDWNAPFRKICKFNDYEANAVDAYGRQHVVFNHKIADKDCSVESVAQNLAAAAKKYYVTVTPIDFTIPRIKTNSRNTHTQTVIVDDSYDLRVPCQMLAVKRLSTYEMIMARVMFNYGATKMYEDGILTNPAKLQALFQVVNNILDVRLGSIIGNNGERIVFNAYTTALYNQLRCTYRMAGDHIIGRDAVTTAVNPWLTQLRNFNQNLTYLMDNHGYWKDMSEMEADMGKDMADALWKSIKPYVTFSQMRTIATNLQFGKKSRVNTVKTGNDDVKTSMQTMVLRMVDHVIDCAFDAGCSWRNRKLTWIRVRAAVAKLIMWHYEEMTTMSAPRRRRVLLTNTAFSIWNYYTSTFKWKKTIAWKDLGYNRKRENLALAVLCGDDGDTDLAQMMRVDDGGPNTETTPETPNTPATVSPVSPMIPVTDEDAEDDAETEITTDTADVATTDARAQIQPEQVRNDEPIQADNENGIDALKADSDLKSNDYRKEDDQSRNVQFEQTSVPIMPNHSLNDVSNKSSDDSEYETNCESNHVVHSGIDPSQRIATSSRNGSDCPGSRKSDEEHEVSTTNRTLDVQEVISNHQDDGKNDYTDSGPVEIQNQRLDHLQGYGNQKLPHRNLMSSKVVNNRPKSRENDGSKYSVQNRLSDHSNNPFCLLNNKRCENNDDDVGSTSSINSRSIINPSSPPLTNRSSGSGDS